MLKLFGAKMTERGKICLPGPRHIHEQGAIISHFRSITLRSVKFRVGSTKGSGSKLLPTARKSLVRPKLTDSSQLDFNGSGPESDLGACSWLAGSSCNWNGIKCWLAGHKNKIDDIVN